MKKIIGIILTVVFVATIAAADVQRLSAPQTKTERWAERLRNDRIFRFFLERDFAQENKIRALEGKQPITRQQYRAAVRDEFINAT